MFASVTWCRAETNTCEAPSIALKESVRQYVAKRLRIPSESRVVVKEEGQANEECAWKFILEITSGTQSRREITEYLMPDRRHLTPVLYDLTQDPEAEIAEQQRKLTGLISAGDPPSLGRADAPVTMAVFTDFECPYCKRLSHMIDELSPEDLREVRIVFRNFPLEMHPWARTAARAAACAEIQSDAAFWNVEKKIFDNQAQMSPDNAQAIIRSFLREEPALDQKQVDTCIEKDFTLGIISRDIELGKQLRISGTPTVFVNGERVRGFKDTPELRAVLKNARDKATQTANDVPAIKRVQLALQA